MQPKSEPLLLRTLRIFVINRMILGDVRFSRRRISFCELFATLPVSTLMNDDWEGIWKEAAMTQCTPESG
jgi:hypothetical protein